MGLLIPYLNNKFFFSYDLLIYTPSGSLKCRLNPLLSVVEKGTISENNFILIKKITKIVINNYFYVLIDQFEVVKFNDSFTNIHNKEINLCNYRKFYPLGGVPGYYYLDVITLNDIIFKSDVLLKEKKASPADILDTISLKVLDNTWTSIKLTRKLIVRVISISKVKLILPKHQHDTLKLLVNLLVCDNTSYCRIIAFDDAAASIHEQIKENDIISIQSYKTSAFKVVKQRYRLQPKKNLLLSPIEIELKLNAYNLNDISILQNENIQTIPPPIWSIHTIAELTENRYENNQLVDIIGVIIEKSRQEKEKMFNNSSPTGQFWLRQWISHQDHTSQEKMYTKLYLSRQNCLILNKILPGDSFIMTNLLVQSNCGIVSHLTSSNETSIFMQNQFKENKFINILNHINALKFDTMNQNIKLWEERCKKQSAIGGYLFPLQETISKNLFDIYYTKKMQIKTLLNVPINTSIRFIVEGKIGSIMKVDIINNIHQFTDIYNAKNDNAIEVYGSQTPLDLPIKVFGYPRQAIKNLYQGLHERGKHTTLNKIEHKDTTILISNIHLDDIILRCEFHQSIDKIVEIPKDSKHKFEIEIFKVDDLLIQFVLTGVHIREQIVTRTSPFSQPCETQDLADFLR